MRGARQGSQYIPWLQLKIDSQREQVTPLEDKLLEVGALSVTLLDNADEPILEPGLGETPLWTNTKVVGLFNADVDTRTNMDERFAQGYRTSCRSQVYRTGTQRARQGRVCPRKNELI